MYASKMKMRKGGASDVQRDESVSEDRTPVSSSPRIHQYSSSEPFREIILRFYPPSTFAKC